MKKRFICFMMIALILSCLSGCKGKENVTDDENGSTLDEALGTGSSDDSGDLSDDVSEDPDEDETFHFLDVLNNGYEAIINPNVPKNEYNDDLFIYSDNKHKQILSYDDDRFSSRFGIDVSKYQGEINWKKVKKSGVEFAFIRIGYRGYGEEGTLNEDSFFRANIEGAQAEGIDVGVYFFSQAVNEKEAKKEARFVKKLLAGYELQLPVVFDPEHIKNDTARTDHVSGEQFTANARAFCDAIKAAGYEPMVYANLVWEVFELDLEQIKDIPMWYADYQDFPQTPYDFKVWQYSESGHIKGVKGNVDLNIMLIEK